MVSVKTKDEKFNPFPGLRPFATEESDYFFGRENESSEIAGKLIRNRFVVVTGASGSGKSSLILCGVLPRIRNLSSKGAGKWRILTMKPGNDPFGNLTSAFVDNIAGADYKKESGSEILKLLKEDPDGIAEVIIRLSSEIDGKVVLFIDQFEELFRYGSPETGIGTGTETAAFINLLTNSIAHNNPDFHLIIAIRSDLISACERYRGFTELLNNSNYLVSMMNREQFREVILGPIESAGAKIDHDLTELLLDEVNLRTDQLPVLQHALMRTWARWQEMDEPERPIDFSDYSSVGTMKDAISSHADEIYNRLTLNSRKICEKLFKIITGKGSDNKGIRYPSNIRTIRSAVRCTGDELTEVIEEFRNPSISVLSPHHSIPLDDDSIIDLSHESLIRLWDRLKRWVDEESASVQMYLRLSEASALYQQGKTGLLKQPDLQLAINWREENKPSLWWAQKYNPAYERAIVYLRTSEKEFIESEERKARHNKWRLHRIRIISSILGAVAILTALTMVAAFISKLSADNRRKIAEKQKNEIAVQKKASDEYAAVALKRSVEADSNAIAASRREQMERILRKNAENQILFGKNDILEAHRESESAIKASLVAMMNADSALLLKNETQRLRMISVAKTMSLRSLQVPEKDDLQALLAYQAFLFNKRNRGNRNDADIYMGLYNLAKLKGSSKLKTFSGIEGQIKSIAFIPGKNEFFTSGSDGKVLRWDLDNKDQSFRIVYSDNEVIDVMAVSPKSDWLACGGANSSIKMIPLKSNDQTYELKGHSGSIKSLIFSYDGNSLYSAALDGKVLKWDLAARTSTDLSAEGMHITSIDLSTSNRYLAGISDQGKAMVWNPESNTERLSIGSSGKKIRSIRFKPDEERIAVGYDDGMVELWDIALKKKVAEFQAHSGEINDIRFNPRFAQMATAGNDGTLKLWDTSDLINPPVSFTDNEGLVIAFEFSPDGEVILAGSVGSQTKLRARPAYADSFAIDGCSYVTRNFTPDEWLAYVGKDISYEKTCDGADYKIKIREVR
jgi:WD40 repeat protein/energy-coupling factor transporter ATP-binding protein EcfA2